MTATSYWLEKKKTQGPYPHMGQRSSAALEDDQGLGSTGGSRGTQAAGRRRPESGGVEWKDLG